MSRAPILFITHEASRTGAPILLLNLMRWLKQHTSWEMKILLGWGGELSGEFATLADPFTLPPATAPSPPPPPTRNWFGRRRPVPPSPPPPEPESFSLVYSNTATNGAALETLGGRQPVISHVHELETTIRIYGEANFDSVRRHTTRYIACADAVKRDLTTHWPIAPQDVDVIHEFVHLPPLMDASAKAAMRYRIRSELGIPQDAFVVGGSGHAAWRKSPDLFIALARAIKKRRPSPDMHFLWVGALLDAFPLPALERDLRGLGLEGQVHFIGARPNPLDYFQAFDLFAMVSREDPFPLVCLEVASLGTPLVCFATAGGIPELVEGDCGFVLPYLDVDAMAEAVLMLSQCDQLRTKQGQCAEAKVRDRYDINIAAPRILDVIERLL